MSNVDKGKFDIGKHVCEFAITSPMIGDINHTIRSQTFIIVDHICVASKSSLKMINLRKKTIN